VNNYECHAQRDTDRHSHDSGNDSSSFVRQFVSSGRLDQDHAENDNQNSTPEMFLRHMSLS